jgi:hypothetical protein
MGFTLGRVVKNKPSPFVQISMCLNFDATLRGKHELYHNQNYRTKLSSGLLLSISIQPDLDLILLPQFVVEHGEYAKSSRTSRFSSISSRDISVVSEANMPSFCQTRERANVF